MKLWINWISNCFLDFIFPFSCAYCQKIGSVICEKCFEEIEFYTHQPLDLKIPNNQLDSLSACCQYSGPIKALIKNLKYQSIKKMGEFAGQLLYNCSWPPQNIDCLTAVPLHKKRLKQRGFNQAEIIAQTLASELGKPYLNLLVRKSNTLQQAKLKDKALRQTQLVDQFEFAKPSAKNHNSQHLGSVLLIDDVVTTGSTLNECAKTLKAAGVKKVYALCVAHGL